MSDEKTCAGKHRVPLDDDVHEDLKRQARLKSTTMHGLANRWLRAQLARCRFNRK